MKKIFMLLAMVMTVVTASAAVDPTYNLTKGDGAEDFGTVSFKVGTTEPATTAAEGDEVYVKVTSNVTGRTVGAVTGLWYANESTVHAPHRAGSTTLPYNMNFNPTFVEKQGDTWIYKFTMINANARISVNYAKIIQDSWIQPISSMTFAGYPLRPNVVVIDDENKTLTQGIDYTVSYKNNIDASRKATAIVTGIGNYAGTASRTFTINKATSGVYFNPDKYTKTFGDPDFTIEPINYYGGGSLTYSSDNKSVATVNRTTGLVHIVGIGKAWITATLSGSTNYYSAADSYELTVLPKQITLNVPASGMGTYCGGWALNFTGVENPKAYTVIGCSYDSKTIWLSRVYDVPAYTPIVLMGDEGSYTLDCASSSNSYFKNMLIANTSGSTIEINEQNDEGTMDNYYVKDGTFKKVNNFAYIANGKSYLQLPANPAAGQAGSAKSITLSSTGKSTLCSDVDLDFSNFDKDDLAAYVATGYDMGTKTFWFNRVLTASAGTPLYLIGQPNKSYDIPSAAAQTAFVNMLVGNLSGNIIEVKETAMVDGVQMRNLYLKDGTFMLVKSSAKISDGKCYMQTPLSTVVASQAPAMDEPVNNIFTSDDLVPVKFSDITDDSELTGIDSLTPDPSPKGEGSIYMLDGRKVGSTSNVQRSTLKKGVYILNGKKVVR